MKNRVLASLVDWTRDNARDASLLGVLIVLAIVFSILSPNFASTSNLLSIARSAVEIGLISMGMAVVIASGGIDLSVGSVVALSSVVLGYTHAQGIPLELSLIIALAVAVACGTFNGFLVATMRLHPLVVTLGTLALFRGVALGISRAGGLSGFPDWFLYFGQYYVGALPGQLLAWVVIGIVLHVLVTRTIWGRHVLALGISASAAWFSGVRVRRTTVAIYALSGLLSGIAAVIFTSRVFSARGDVGEGLELQAIAAVVVGGASISGGTISIPRTTLAVLVIGVIPNGLALAGVDTNWRFVVIGAVMVFAVALNQLPVRRRRGAEAEREPDVAAHLPDTEESLIMQ